MSVKIRCRGCEKILNAPDKARGHVIKCPNCQTKLKVPGGDAAAQNSAPAAAAEPKRAKTRPAAPQRKPATPQRKKVKAAASKPPGSDSDFFAALDLAEAEDRQQRICPFCAADMPDEEDDVCPECGMNTATRQIDAKVAKKRARTKKGVNPEKFYKGAWGDSLQFVKENTSLALRTGWYWTMFGVLLGACYFMAVHYCEKGPPKFFWACLTFVCALGLPGWYWYLSIRVVNGTMQRQEKFDRIHFDFFECVTIGSRAIFWPAIMLLPFFPVIIALVVVNAFVASPMMSVVLFCAFFAFPLISFPLAMVHMTAKYTYKAWILWEMLKVFVKNVGPSLYWCVMALVTFLLPFGGLLAAIEFAGGGINPFTNPHFTGAMERGVAWAFSQAGEQPSGWMFTTIVVLLTFAMAFVVAAPLFLAMGFPILFLIRANGLLGLHFHGNLALVNRMAENTPATFWVRLLAYLIDRNLILLTWCLVTADKKALMVSNATTGIMVLLWWFWGVPWDTMAPVWGLLMTYIYFVVSETTTNRATIGKDGFGLIVSNEDNSQMSFGDANKRLFAGILNYATFGLGFVMCAFHPEKKALNDIVSKTKVVWRGDR
jgi:uncharacterized RDD family membrane protein YckC